MRSSLISWPLGVKLLSWLPIYAYLLVTIGYGALMYHLLNAPNTPGTMGLICANSVVDPLQTILQYGTPTALAGVLALGVQWRKRWATFQSVFVASAVFIACTASLVTFGILVFQTLPNFHLSDGVWWMSPLGKLAGI